MARPIKPGLSYFPHNVSLLKDMKFRKLKNKYGILAPYVYISLLELCYEDNGYYIDYSDKDSVIDTVLTDCQGKYCPTPETIENVIEDLVAAKLFSADKFKQQIITSRRIQINYYMGKLKSALIVVNPLFWLLSLLEMKGLNPNSGILTNLVNSETTQVNSELTTIDTELIPQSREEESRVVESNKESKQALETYNNLIDNYTENSELKQSLIEYIKMRKLINRPLTNNALKLKFIDLNKLSTTDEDKVLILNNSVKNSYPNIYAIQSKNDKETTQPTKAPKLALERNYIQSQLDEMLVVDNYDF